jgi:hypothetical protein
MYSKGDKIKLLDGTPGRIDCVVKTDLKNIYRIIFLQTGEEGYFEEDKLIPVERSTRNWWKRIRDRVLR